MQRQMTERRIASPSTSSLELDRCDTSKEQPNEKLLSINIRHRARIDGIPRYPPIKTTVAAMLMLLAGIGFLISGLVIYFGKGGDRSRGLPLFVLGAMLFLPGSYASFTLYGAWRRWPGYDYGQIPSYDNE